MTIDQWAGLCGALALLLTAYVTGRTVWIWCKYHRAKSGTVNPQTLGGILKLALRRNSPGGIPSKDLIWALLALAVAAAIAFILKVWALFDQG